MTDFQVTQWSDVPTTGSLSDYSRWLDGRMALSSFDIENVQGRVDLFHQIHRAVAPVPALPSDLPESVGGRLVSTLWCRAHPTVAPFEYVLEAMHDTVPVVRVAALDVVEDRLTGESNLPPPDLTQVRTHVEQQRAVENTPLVALKLARLSDRLAGEQAAARKKPRLLRLNPYTAGLPIRADSGFYGRVDVLNKIKAALETPGVNTVVLQGSRRTGKTSLLLQIQRGAFGEDYFPVYFDQQTVAGEPIGRALQALTREVEIAVARDGITLGPRSRYDDPFQDLAEVLRLTQDAIDERSLLLLIDEYEVLADVTKDKDVARRFQSLYEETDVAWIYAGAQKLEQQRANLEFLFDSSKYVRMTFLSPDDTRRLVTEPAKGQLQFQPEAIERIHELTAGHPFYVQLVCQAVFDQAVPGGKVTRETVDRVAEELVQSPPPHLILSWNALGFEHRVVGAALATVSGNANRWIEPLEISTFLRMEKFPLRLGPSRVAQVLRALVDTDWVEQRNQKMSHRYAMYLARDWVGWTHTIWDVLKQNGPAVLESAAGYWTQLATWVIDFALMFVTMIIGLFVGAVISGQTSESVTESGIYAGVALALLAYFGVFQIFRETPGMRITRLRLKPVNGVRVERRQLFALSVTVAIRFVLWALAVAAAVMFATEDPDTGIVFLTLFAIAELSEWVAVWKWGRGWYTGVAGLVMGRELGG